MDYKSAYEEQEQQIGAYDQALAAFEVLRKNIAAWLREQKYYERRLYGGFGLSEAPFERLIELGHIKLSEDEIKKRRARAEEYWTMYGRLRDVVAVGPGKLSSDAVEIRREVFGYDGAYATN